MQSIYHLDTPHACRIRYGKLGFLRFAISPIDLQHIIRICRHKTWTILSFNCGTSYIYRVQREIRDAIMVGVTS